MVKLDSPEFVDKEFAFVIFPVGALLFLFICLLVFDGWPDSFKLPLEQHLRPAFLTRDRRTFKDFTDKKTTKELRAGLKEVPLQPNYNPTRLHLYSQLFRAAPVRIWKTVLMSGLFCLSISWGIVNVVHFGRMKLLTVFKLLEAAAVVLEIVLPLASCLLALYVYYSLMRIWMIVGHVSSLQHALEEVALIVSCGTADRSSEDEVMFALYVLDRYLNLVHILVYLQLSARFQHHTLGDLSSTGFISHTEKKLLDNAIDPSGLALMWTGHLLTHLHYEEVLESTCVNALMKSFAAVRSLTSELVQEVRRKPPPTVHQLVNMLIDVVCILAAPVLIRNFLWGREYPEEYMFSGSTFTSTMTSTTTSTTTTTTTIAYAAARAMLFQYSRLSIYLCPVVGTMFITLIYQGCLQLVRDTEDPFAVTVDGLNPEVSLVRTEKKLFFYLRRHSDLIPTLRLPRVVRQDEEEIDAELEADVMSLAGLRRPESLLSATSTAIARNAEPDGKHHLPNGVSLTRETISTLTTGAHEEARMLHGIVNEKLTKFEADLLAKIGEDDPYVTAVCDLVPKLHQASLANAELREQVIKTISGMAALEESVLEAPGHSGHAPGSATRASSRDLQSQASSREIQSERSEKRLKTRESGFNDPVPEDRGG